MLLKALINRVTKSSKTTAAGGIEKHRPYAKATYGRFPQLSDLISALLNRTSLLITGSTKNDDWEVQYEVAIPALQIISKVGILPRDREKVKGLLLQHLQSRLWNVRVQAARTLGQLIDTEELLYGLEAILERPWPSTNLVHGYLHCLREHLTHRPFRAGRILARLMGLCDALLSLRTCPFVITAYLQNICRAARFCCDAPQERCAIKVQSNGEALQQTHNLRDDIESFLDTIRKFRYHDTMFDIPEQLICTSAVLDLCKEKIGNESGKSSYPLSHFHSFATDIPNLMSIRLAACNVPTEEPLRRIVMTLELLQAIQEVPSTMKDCAKVLDQAAFSIARELDDHRFFDAPQNYEYVATINRLVTAQLQTILSSLTPEEDLLRNAQLVFCGAALAWKLQPLSRPDEYYPEGMSRYGRMIRVALQDESVSWVLYPWSYLAEACERSMRTVLQRYPRYGITVLLCIKTFRT
jgi:hypothetical protein